MSSSSVIFPARGSAARIPGDLPLATAPILIVAIAAIALPAAADDGGEPPWTPPPEDPGGGAGGSVWITGPPLLCVGGEIELIASGLPGESTFSWTLLAGAAHVALEADGSSAWLQGLSVSADPGDVEIELEAELPDGSTERTTWRGTVIDVDLVLRRSPIIDPAETAIPEALEESVGGQVWENVDNDDRDGAYDLFDSPVGPEVDDELAMVELRLWPAGVTGGYIGLAVHEGLSYVSLWRDAHKSEPVLGEAVFDFAELAPSYGGASSLLLWIEGVEACQEQREVLLELRTSASFAEAGSDLARYTVLGAGGIALEARENGFTEDGRNDSDTLDETKTVGVGGGDLEYRRVFPGARAPDTDEARDKVGVRVTIDPKPVEPVVVYLRSLDQDDPSDEYVVVDPNDCTTQAGKYLNTDLDYDAHNDNRGAAGGGVTGKLKGAAGDGIEKLVFGAGVGERTTELQVGHQPGDNYRLVCSPDRAFLKRLENLDAFDQAHVVDPEDPERGPIPKWSQYTSDVLEVWRTVHLEWDSMRAPTYLSNGASGEIAIYDSKSREVYVKDAPLTLNGEEAASLHDGSPNQADGKPGRFENGKLDVAFLGELLDIESNCDLLFTLAKVPPRPTFELRDKDGDNPVSGEVKAFYPADHADGGTEFDVHVSVGMKKGLYAGGLFVIEDEVFLDVLDNANLSLRTKEAKIPFFATDDDVNWVLPDRANALPGVDSGRRPTLSSIYAPAYIDVVQDGGGMGKEVQTVDVEVDINIDLDDWGKYEDRFDSEENKHDLFWIAYCLSAFQDRTTGDADPHADPDGALGRGGGGSLLVYLETIRDYFPTSGAKFHANEVIEVVAHEIGHCFGLSHYDPPQWPPNLMTAGHVAVLLDEQLHLLRSRVSGSN